MIPVCVIDAFRQPIYHRVTLSAREACRGGRPHDAAEPSRVSLQNPQPAAAGIGMTPGARRPDATIQLPGTAGLAMNTSPPAGPRPCRCRPAAPRRPEGRTPWQPNGAAAITP